MDLKAFLLEHGVKPDQIDAVLPALAPAADALDKGFLRQSDYSRLTGELQIKQTALDTANERLNQEILDWNAARDAGEPITEQMRNDLAKAQGEVTRLTTILTTKAAELHLDPKTIIGEVVSAAPANREPAAQVVDLSGYAKAEDINARLGRFADYMMLLPAEVNDIAQEHFDLTGTRISTREIMQEVRDRASNKANFDTAGQPKKPIDARAVWEEKYNIPKLRTDRAQAAHDEEIRQAELRGEDRARTQHTLPGAEAPGRNAVVFKHPADHKPALQRGPAAVLDRVSSAAASLATHKYRQKAS